eukprot:TRINITY_DN2904_c0_g1_i12.p2 TRINITY_DN2904_c0_g1~~TRINITY_DN2904_c0_g1_i12.p2  ORF type:complete len:377 (-),score=84.79 TRINITY_DN2904_c0_g1_i12:4285-5415(-)
MAAPTGLLQQQGDANAVEVYFGTPQQQQNKKKQRCAGAAARNPLRLYKYADPLDALLALLGVASALAQGCTTPLMAFYMGNLVDAFYPILPVNVSVNASGYAESIEIGVRMHVIMKAVRIVFYLGLGSLAATFVYVICFRTSALRQAARIRNRYLKSVMSQEMAWIDSKRAGELSERVNGINKIQDAIGDKVGVGLSTFSTLVSGLVIALSKGWKMALVIISVTPSIVVVVIVMSFLVRMLTTKSLTASAKAGGVAEEVIACIRTVSSFGLQESETERYDKFLAQSEAVNKWKGFAIGAGMGSLMCACFCINAFGFWYGSKLIRTGEMSAGEVTTVFMSVMMATMSLAGVSTPIQAISEGQGCADPFPNCRPALRD